MHDAANRKREGWIFRPALLKISRRVVIGWILATPAIVVFLVFKWYLIVSLFLNSFQQLGLFNQHHWVGFANYVALLHNPGFVHSFIATLIWILVGTVMTAFPPLLLALALQGAPGKAFWRAVYFLPGIFSWAMEGPIWIYLLTPDQGPIAKLFGLLGISEPNWLNNPHDIFFVLGALLLWQQAGFLALFYLAGLANMGTDVLEAALVDGASSLQRFFRIILPLTLPTIGVVTLIVLSQTFSGFSEIYVVTGVGVYQTTQVLTLWIYSNGIVAGDIGLASAASVLLFLMTIVATYFGLRNSEGTTP